MPIDPNERYYPFDAGDGQFVTEIDWGLMAANWQDSGVNGSGTGSGLSASPTPATPFSVRLQAGDAFVRGFFYHLGVVKDLVVPNWTDGLGPRLDYVALKLDNTANTLTPVIVVGTLNTLPSLPADHLPLATYSVNNSGTVTITADKRVYLGNRMWHYASATQPQPTAPATNGQPLFDDTNAKLYFSNTSAWVEYKPKANKSPATSVYRAGAFSLSGTALTAIPWDTEIYEVNTPADSMHSTSVNPTRIIAPVDGIYRVTWGVQLASNTGARVQTNIRRNGTNVRWHSYHMSDPANIGTQSFEMNMLAGEYAELFVSSTVSGHALVLGSTLTSLQMSLVTAT